MRQIGITGLTTFAVMLAACGSTGTLTAPDAASYNEAGTGTYGSRGRDLISSDGAAMLEAGGVMYGAGNRADDRGGVFGSGSRATDATLRDTQLRVPGSIVRDGGFGLGSGGITSSAPGEAAAAGEGAVVQEAGGHTFGGGK